MNISKINIIVFKKSVLFIFVRNSLLLILLVIMNIEHIPARIAIILGAKPAPKPVRVNTVYLPL